MQQEYAFQLRLARIASRVVGYFNDLISRCQRLPDNIVWPVVLMGSVGLLLIALLYFSDGYAERPERWFHLITYVASSIGMLVMPVVLVASHRRRQRRTMDRIRKTFAVSLELVMGEQLARAQRGLLSIRRFERHWRIGNSRSYRFAYTAMVIAATGLTVATHYFFATNISRHNGTLDRGVPDPTLAETVAYLLERPWALAILAIVAGLYSLTAIGHLRDLRSEEWRGFYGDRLAQILRAGRGIHNAPWRDGMELPGHLSARELFGLPERFTKAELRRAWVRIARDLHPDRWASAGAGVAATKEAALKRVNAARDELESHAI